MCRLMPALLKKLKHKKDLLASELYLLSAVTALLKVVETLPLFLSPYLLDTLLHVSKSCVIVKGGLMNVYSLKMHVILPPPPPPRVNELDV